MTILQSFKNALYADIDTYSQYYLDLGYAMPAHRANDVVRIKQMIERADLASALRESLLAYMEAMPKETVIERWFGLDFSWLNQLFRKTLAKKQFMLITLLTIETQQLFTSNQAYREELRELKAFHGELQSMDLAALKEQLDTLSEIRSQMAMLTRENQQLSETVAALTDENARLRAALNDANKRLSTSHADVAPCARRRSISFVGSPKRHGVDVDAVSTTSSSSTISADTVPTLF